MNEIVTLRTKDSSGKVLTAAFAVSTGMNLLSYKKGEIEVIDQSTKDLFEERSAGLGALIGPHFHHRDPDTIPHVKNPELFPHIAKVWARGVKDPFSHGIGRYAPWTVEASSETELVATLSGDSKWKGVPLKELEGQNFTMRYAATLRPEGLSIGLSVNGEKGSVMGLHTYYALYGKQGKIISQVQPLYNDHGKLLPVSEIGEYTQENTLTFGLNHPADFGFLPFPDSKRASINLITETYKLRIHYECINEENSWQLWRPVEKSFVCIEPLSAKDPRKPHLNASGLQILLSIL